MRFAPPKSAPPDRRSLAKETSEAHYGPILSGWLSPQDLRAEDTTFKLQDEEDVTLLKECAAASKRRCSSAAIQRLKFSHSAFVQLEKLGRLNVSKSETNLTSTLSNNNENGSCTVSKDSGVSELVSTSSMDRFRLEDDEFSDLSDSDDSSIKEELQLSWSSKTSLLEDTAAVEEARSEIKQYLDKLNKFKDLSVRGEAEKPSEYQGEFKKGIVRSHTMERSPTKRSKQQRSQTPDDRQSASYHRDRTIPHTFTTDLPENYFEGKQLLGWTSQTNIPTAPAQPYKPNSPHYNDKSAPLLFCQTMPQNTRSICNLGTNSPRPHTAYGRNGTTSNSTSSSTSYPRQSYSSGPYTTYAHVDYSDFDNEEQALWKMSKSHVEKRLPYSNAESAPPLLSVAAPGPRLFSGGGVGPQMFSVCRAYELESPTERPSQTQLWSKRQKERLQNIKNQGATSPLLTQPQPQSVVVNNKVNKQSSHFPGSLLQLNDTAHSNGVKINLESVMGSLYSRPPYRNEKRRGSSISKSSASIPSLSTPCQALLLVGVQPAKPLGTTKNTKKSNRNSGAFKPSLPSSQYAKYVQDEQSMPNLVELPALMVNGAGDLVIKKKQIMPT